MNVAELQLLLPRGESVGPGETAFLRVHSDSRTLVAGDLFVALAGERFDGNVFLSEVAKRGAVAAIATSKKALMQSGLPGIVVSDASMALLDLSAAWRQRFNIPVIGVTGSNGKTTVTQMLAAVLQAQHGDAALATAGNYNNHIGVPLTLLRFRAFHRSAVIELGMNHPGEITTLSRIAAPTVALVNNAQREHQEFMGSVEAVAEENGAVFTSLSSDGVAVFPSDEPHHAIWNALSGHCQRCLFSASGGKADVLLLKADWATDGKWRVAVRTPDGVLDFGLRMVGFHNVRNALAVLACAFAARIPVDAVVKGLETFVPVTGRSNFNRMNIKGREVQFIDDSYNANPDSVRAAIDMLKTLAGPRLLVLGDMGEVGSQGPAFHEEIGLYARQCGIDELWACGPLGKYCVDAFGRGSHFQDAPSLIDAMDETVFRFHSTLVKGSRFMRMERVVQRMRDLAKQIPEARCS